MSEYVEISQQDRVVKIRLMRPDKKNAITRAMYDAMTGALAQASGDPLIRAVLITGSGGMFTAGNDLADFRDHPPVDADSPVMRFLDTLVLFEKPVVAAVNGGAVGIGLTMLLHCDLVYAGKSASFSAPFVNLALVPEAGSSLLLPALIGHARAAEIFLLGSKIDAEEAASLGIVTRVVADAELGAYADAQAATLAARAPEAVRITKRLMRGDGRALGARMREEAAAFARQLQSPEVLEAITAFYQKRPAVFR